MQTAFHANSKICDRENSTVLALLEYIDERKNPVLLNDIVASTVLGHEAVEFLIERMAEAGFINKSSVLKDEFFIESACEITIKGMDLVLASKDIDPEEVKVEVATEILQQAEANLGTVPVNIPDMDDKYISALIRIMEKLEYVETVAASELKEGIIVTATSKGAALLNQINGADERQKFSNKRIPFEFKI